MKKQRIGAWPLAVLMLLGNTAAGCAGGQDSKAESSKGDSSAAESSKAEESSAEADSIFNAPGELPMVKEPVTLSIFAPSNGEYSWAEEIQRHWSWRTRQAFIWIGRSRLPLMTYTISSA